MKIILSILLLTAAPVLACGPYFPPSYLSDLDSCFIENINVTKELELIAQEYGILETRRFWSGGGRTAAEADQYEFCEAAGIKADAELSRAFAAYAAAIRAGETNRPSFEVPENLREFTLYLEGVAEMKADPDLTAPRAWAELLGLPATNRLHRTVWVHYMLGNLAATHGDPAAAAEHWAACRDAEEAGFDDLLGLANASLKTEYLAQTNLAERIYYGVKAIAYYSRKAGSEDQSRMKHCFEHLRVDVRNMTSFSDPLQLEVAALFRYGDDRLIGQLNAHPPLTVTPRLAWFMYRSGEIEKAAAYLEACPEEDTLSIWLRFRVAQRNGQTTAAIGYLRDWMKRLREDDRIVYEFEYDGGVAKRDAAYGNLGSLLASQNQMLDAMTCFIEAGAYPDAALLAERYIGTEELIHYVERFETRPADTPYEPYYNHYKQHSSRAFIERNLACLLARRLFREGRPEEALPYYPPETAAVLQDYLNAVEQGRRIWSPRNIRSAHLYHAARILRWKGMELCGTEFGPDYYIVNGLFDWSGLTEQIGTPVEVPAIYAETAPEPDLRFHYRHNAAALAGEAARLSWNRHQRAMILWSAGTWLKMRHPDDADIYYKQLARVRYQPLAIAADQKRWFPAPTWLMNHVHTSRDYIEPKRIARAAKEFGGNQGSVSTADL